MRAAKRAKLIRKLKKASRQPTERKEQAEEEVTLEELPIVRNVGANNFLVVMEEGKAYRLQAIGSIKEVVGHFEVNGLNSEIAGKLALQGAVIIDRVISKNLPVEEIVSRLSATCSDSNIRETVVGLYNPKHVMVLIQCTAAPVVCECSEPWPESMRQLAESMSNRSSVLTVGVKNSGKSTLCRYLANCCGQLGKQVCLLDCDPGKGFHLPGTVSLTCYDGYKVVDSYCYWIGEYSPLNFVQLYLESIERLLAHYREKYFGSALIVNTMGYLTGLGELLLFELYNIVQPTQVLLLSNQKNDTQLENIHRQLTNGSYQQRMYFLKKETVKEIAQFLKVVNPHATVKHHAPQSKSKAYEMAVGVSSVKELLLKRNRYQLNEFSFAFQSRNGAIQRMPFDSRLTDIQLVAICAFEGSLFRLISLGYGIKDKIYLPSEPKTTAGLLCLKSELVQFDKQFYNISEKELIQLEEFLEERVPWLLPSYQALGTAGYRNLQSKSQRRH